MQRIPLLIPDMPRADELIELLREIDDHRWYTNFGPLAKRFEAQLAGGFRQRGPVSVVSLANCTLALELLLAACRLPAGSTVLVPALTFVATGTAIRRAGYRLLLADVDPQRWSLTPQIARAAAQAQRVDCVIPVTALGFVLPNAAVGALGASLVGCSGIGVALALLTAGGPPVTRAARRAAGIALLVGMPLGIGWSVAGLLGIGFIDLDAMVRTHGALNAFAIVAAAVTWTRESCAPPARNRLRVDPAAVQVTLTPGACPAHRLEARGTRFG